MNRKARAIYPGNKMILGGSKLYPLIHKYMVALPP